MNMKCFKLGAKSARRLKDARADLAWTVKDALTNETPYDFSVTEVLRSRQKQRANIRAGVSWTMNTRHFKQDDGTVWAVDLIGWVDSASNSDESVLIEIAEAMRRSARKIKMPLIWGGCWRDIAATDQPLIEMVAEYRAAKGDDAKVDMPHFECTRTCGNIRS